MNTLAPKLIVEMCRHTTTKRWWFIVEDEEGSIVHRGEERMLKTEAMNDRSIAVRDCNGRREPTADRFIRCVRRGVYVTRDDPRMRR